ncbi:MAG: transglutaminase-like domain-containing protein [Planctomycetota bacterium]
MIRYRHGAWLLAVVCAAAAMVLPLAGCGVGSTSGSGGGSQTTVAEAADTVGTPITDRETWDLTLMQGQPVGYVYTRVKAVERDGQRLLEIEGEQKLSVKRYGDSSEQIMRFRSHETPDGKLVDFESSSEQSPVPQTSRGRVVGERLEIQSVSAGKPENKSIPWPAGFQGFFAAEGSLLRSPMQPGEKRSFRSLLPLYNVPIATEFVAADYEMTPLRGSNVSLLRIDGTMRVLDAQGKPLPGAPATLMTVWCDRTGNMLKQLVGPVETIRTTKAEATQESKPGELDLGLDLAVKVDRPIPNPHSTKRVRYRVELAQADPAAFFPSGASQQVVSKGPHVAEVTVFALRPGVAGNPRATADPPTAADMQPNSMIQSDDPQVLKRAAEAVGDETDPWKAVLKLEKYVSQTIVRKDFTQAFATAAEVAENPGGDCTEHAVLLAALARARQIPARVVMGLVYMPGSQSFNYHMWTEVFLDGKWIPLDATLGQGGIGAAHLKLATSDLSAASAVASMLPVVQIAGQLKIAVEEIE